MRSHCVLVQKMTFLRCTCMYLLYFEHQNQMRFVTGYILTKHTRIMRLHGVLILKYIMLLTIFHSLKPLGWLAFHSTRRLFYSQTRLQCVLPQEIILRWELVMDFFLIISNFQHKFYVNISEQEPQQNNLCTRNPMMVQNNFPPTEVEAP